MHLESRITQMRACHFDRVRKRLSMTARAAPAVEDLEPTSSSPSKAAVNFNIFASGLKYFRTRVAIQHASILAFGIAAAGARQRGGREGGGRRRARKRVQGRYRVAPGEEAKTAPIRRQGTGSPSREELGLEDL